jgi:hypothetical protein
MKKILQGKRKKVPVYAVAQRSLFVKFSKMLTHGQKLPKLLAHYFKPLIPVCTSHSK